MIHVLALTMVALWPPETDTTRICLVVDGVIARCVESSQAVTCARFDDVLPTGGIAYWAVAVDSSGNVSEASDVLNGLNIWDVVRRQRDLAGLP